MTSIYYTAHMPLLKSGVYREMAEWIDKAFDRAILCEMPYLSALDSVHWQGRPFRLDEDQLLDLDQCIKDGAYDICVFATMVNGAVDCGVAEQLSLFFLRGCPVYLFDPSAPDAPFRQIDSFDQIPVATEKETALLLETERDIRHTGLDLYICVENYARALRERAATFEGFKQTACGSARSLRGMAAGPS